jgi:hypothetical protein
MPQSRGRYVICVRNGTYRASLEPRKVYRVLEDAAAEKSALVRVIDESGEDYLFPSDLFVPIDVPAKARPAFTRATVSGVSRPARRSRRPTKRS